MFNCTTFNIHTNISITMIWTIWITWKYCQCPNEFEYYSKKITSDAI